MHNKLLFLSFSLLLFSQQLHAQVVGVGTNTPNNSAKLDITDNNRGLLIPRINIPNLLAAAPVTTPAVSLLVYNTNATTGLGFYYWNGTRWVRFDDTLQGDHDWYEQNTTRPSDNINDNIYTEGRVGIGVTNPTHHLHVGGYVRIGTLSPIGTGGGLPSEGARLIFSGGSAPATLYNSENSDPIWMARYNSARDQSQLRVNLGDNSQAEDAMIIGHSTSGGFIERIRLETTGNALRPGGGAWAALSDRRSKKEVQPFTDGLQVLEQINPVTYQYNGLYGTVDDGQRYVGIIAQEVAPVAPYMIETRDLKKQASDQQTEEILQYDGGTHLLYILVNAVKEQQVALETEKAKNKQLEERLEALEKRLQALEK